MVGLFRTNFALLRTTGVLLALTVAWPSMPDLHGAIDAPGEYPHEADIQDVQPEPWSLWQSHLDHEGLQEMMEDRAGRIPLAFNVPRELRPQVLFWLEIYTRYTSREAVIFDEEHPDVVYEILDFRSLARTSRNRAAYEIVSRQMLRERIAAYQAAFARLSENPSRKSRRRGPEEQAILRAKRNLPHSHSFAELKKNLRVQWGQRDQVMQGLIASAPYRVRMDHVFEAMGLPRELTLLSLVESSFNPRAVSYAGAAGVWQFMPDSGAEFMRVNPGEGIDERISPIKSTAAAARLLQRNYKMLGSWPAAIGAYNHGHSKWRRIPQEQRREPGKILAQCSRSPKVSVKLGFASRNYFAEFLALLRAERYQDRAFGPPPSLTGQPVRFVSVGAPSRVDSLAQEHGLAPKTLLELNPDILSAGRLIPSGFLLAVPAKQDEFKTVIAEVGARQRRFQTNRSARKSALQAAYSTSPGSYAASGRKRKG